MFSHIGHDSILIQQISFLKNRIC